MAAVDVHRALLARDVPHEVVRLRRGAVSVDDLPRVLDLPAEQVVAVRCYVADGRTVAVLVHAGEAPDPAALLGALGADTVRPATAHEVNAATDCSVGLVSPVGLPPALTVLADAALEASEVVYTAAAESGVALGIRTRDLLLATGARVVRLAPRPLAATDRDGLATVLDLDAGTRRATAPG